MAVVTCSLLLLLSTCMTSAVQSQEDLERLCASLPDRRILPHPDDCALFVECFNNFPYVRRCGLGLHYNPASHVCDYPAAARCPHANKGAGSRQDNRVDIPHPTVLFRSPRPTQHVPTHPRTLRPRPRQPPTHPPRQVSYRPSFQETVYGMSPRSTRPAPVAQMSKYGSQMVRQAKALVRERMRNELAASRQMRDVVDSGPYRYVSRFMNAKPYAKHIAQAGMCMLETFRLLKNRLQLPASDMMAAMGGERSGHLLRRMTRHARPDHPMPTIPDVDYCPYPSLDCDPRVRFRSHDGSCNNLKRTLIGRAMTPFRRMLEADYDDGIESMRRAVSGRPLPGARHVSRHVFPDSDRPDRVFSMKFVFWGQFVDHDLTLTAITEAPMDEKMDETMELKCGFDGCQERGPGLEACWPIPVPDNDEDFPYNRCIKFVRSVEVPHLGCQMAPREQLNQLTHWLDASAVYGSTKEDSDKLREGNRPARGRLAMKQHPHSQGGGPGRYLKPLLPPQDEPLCRGTNQTVKCFHAGDERASENSGLTIAHTLMVRQHNRMEAELHHINPHWDGQRLFFETRKIVSALVQHVTYNEFLPVLLGPRFIQEQDLKLQPRGQYYYGYDPSPDARIPNSFGGAAFRYGHTLLQERMNRANTNYEVDDSLFLSQNLMRPSAIYDTARGGIDSLIRGLCEENCQQFDSFFTKQVTKSLFTERPPFGTGLDLIALNIQRGRDHGLPSYNAFRQLCGLRRAHSFDDLRSEIANPHSLRGLADVYGNVDDIDLFAGGIVERPAEGAVVGPTFACIIGRTFGRLRRGDRFWYENDNDVGFSREQLDEIRKITYARILCANADNIDKIQKWVFMTSNNGGRRDQTGDDDRPFYDIMASLLKSRHNPRVLCDSLHDLDLSKWRDGPYTR